jgi:hypothetical protein
MDIPKVTRVKALLDDLERNLKQQKAPGDKFYFLQQTLLELINTVLVYWKAKEQKISDELLAKIPAKVVFLIKNSIHDRDVIHRPAWHHIKTGKRRDLALNCTREQLLYHLENAIKTYRTTLIYANKNRKTLNLRMWNAIEGGFITFEAVFTRSCLKEFIVQIAKEYLEDEERVTKKYVENKTTKKNQL